MKHTMMSLTLKQTQGFFINPKPHEAHDDVIALKQTQGFFINPKPETLNPMKHMMMSLP